MKKYWLMKSEPEVFSIADLKEQKETLWDSVRNYQARNFMTKDMRVGDEVLFYHSNASPSGVAGLATVSKPAQPDPTQFDKKSEYYDPKASIDTPIWYGVSVRFQEMFSSIVTLDEIKREPKLKDMLVIRRGQRLSIQPVSKDEFQTIIILAKKAK